MDNLGPHDRLSVVSFSIGACRVTRLLRMSGDGKAMAKSAVESLVARGGTNIAEGLRTAAKVLDERRHWNTVSSVILLSNGQDTYTTLRRVRGTAPKLRGPRVAVLHGHWHRRLIGAGSHVWIRQ
jgi:Mg-chelatase subunit ChlD